ncbi:MAG: cation diffusion facilitator family transporter [Bdellovibrionaceae bacterium]|nr:cation diffusion facilitator family transporter [Pseudobdellovibrionaceae bacterium]
MTSVLAKKRAALASLLVSLLVFILKALAYHFTGSTAAFSDALETIVNVVTAAVAIFVINFASAPADEEHPYGHGKAEYFSAAFEGGLIFFAAIMIVFEAIRALLRGPEIRHFDIGLCLLVIASMFNLVVGIYLSKVGKRENSEALLASSAHVLSDVKTTAGVLVGLFAVWLTGLKWIDPLVAIGVGLHLGWGGTKIIRRSVSSLIDSVDPEAVAAIAKAIQKNLREGIIDIHNLRIIRSGTFHHIDAHLVVPENWDIRRCHELAGEFEDSVVRDYPFDAEFAFHLDPCQRSFCKKCNLLKCDLRRAPFEESYSFAPADLVKGPQKTN